MKNAIVLFAALLCGQAVWAQEETFRLNVLSFEWTTTHKVITFTWPGSSSTSCRGDAYTTGNVSNSGSFSANTSGSSNCSTTFTPPTNQNIDIQKPVVFILAETDHARMVLTCTRNVRWSQCHSLHPGNFRARNNNGHFEVQSFGKDKKEEWVKFDIVRETALRRQVSQNAPERMASPSIESPTTDANATNVGSAGKWKSMTTGRLWNLRFENEYVYGETVLTEAATKAGVFFLMDVKKDGEKYSGNVHERRVSQDGSRSCSNTWPIELTMVSANRIEGRISIPSGYSKTDWNACTYDPPAEWHDFTWIPVQ